MMIHCLIVAGVLLCSPTRAQSQLQKRTDRTRNVLLINSYRPTYEWTKQTTKGIEDTFTQYKDRIELEIEYMNSRYFSDEKHYKNLYELYKHKAGRRKYDLIITADDNALRFVLRHRDELYPNVPIVFCGIQEIDNVVPKGHDFLTGVYEDKVFEPTLQLALKLHPSAKQVVVVSDGIVDRADYLSQQRLKAMKEYEDRVDFVTHFLRKLTADELLEKIRDLDPHSVVIFADPFKDPEGNLYSFEDNVEKIYQQCKAPIYTMSEEWFGLGPIVGGHIITGFLQGQAAAEIAMRILDGEKPSNIPPPPQTPSKFMFDYNQLQNFGIPLSELPEGSTIINIPKSFYQQYKKLVWLTIIAIAILISAIVLLSVNTLLRTKAEKALRQSEKKFRTLVSNIPGIVYRCANDPEWTMEFISDEIETITGYPASDFIKNKVRPYVDIIHPDDRQMIEQVVQESLDKKKPYIIEFRLVHKDGTIKWLYDKGQGIYDDNGQFLWLDGVLFDITDRKKVEKALKESQGQQSAILNTIPDIAWLKDKNSKYIAVNEQYAGFSGTRPENIVGKTDFDIWPQDLANKYVMADKEVIRSGKRKRFEEQLELKQGKRIWVDTFKTPIFDDKGQIIGTSGIARDITERKLAEEKLKESEQRFRTIFDGAIDGLLLADPKTKKFFAANQACCKMLGYTNEELANLSVKNIHPKDQLKHTLQNFEKQVRGELELAEDVPVKRKDGSVFYVDINTALLTLAGKTYIMGVFRDITERKQTEEQLELYREKMTRAERLASLGTLSAAISHELTQPLTAIRLFIENSLAKIDESKQHHLITDTLKDSLKEVENAVSIVDRFRDFARQSSERNISRVNVKNLTQRIITLLNESAGRANISLICKDMDGLPTLYLNEKDLEQVFFALIVNAIQAADGKKRKRLTISGNVKNGMLELKLADNCKGIPPENLDKIFEPFFTTKPPGEGTGLGLCIVQRILSGYGGKIRVDSKAGKGAAFYVTLPIHQNKIG